MESCKNTFLYFWFLLLGSMFVRHILMEGAVFWSFLVLGRFPLCEMHRDLVIHFRIDGCLGGFQLG